MTAATGLEEVNYPWPLFIKNTFLDGKVPRSQSFEECFEERRMRSCPASMVDATAESACDCEENLPPTRPRCAVATDLLATCSSTSTDSSAAPSTERDRCSDDVTLPYHSQSSDCGAQHLQKLRGLPEFEYPGLIFQEKGTFIHTDLARPFSLDDFLEDSNLQSCPGSVIACMDDIQVSTVAETTKHKQEPSVEFMHLHQIASDGLIAACVPTLATDLFAACSSTSTDSSSAPSAERDNCSDDVNLLHHSQSSDCRAQHLQKRPGLPEFQYPGPDFQKKGAFIHTDLARRFSLDEFLEDRNLQSCLGSVVAGMDDIQVSTVAETTKRQQEQPVEFMHSHQITSIGLMAACVPTITSNQLVVCEWMQPHAGFLLQDSSEAQKEQAKAHTVGACKPCAHFHTTQGCKMGATCHFCHACPPGELKRRQRQRRRAMRGRA